MLIELNKQEIDYLLNNPHIDSAIKSIIQCQLTMLDDGPQREVIETLAIKYRINEDTQLELNDAFKNILNDGGKVDVADDTKPYDNPELFRTMTVPLGDLKRMRGKGYYFHITSCDDRMVKVILERGISK